jgi:hypothetical protein
MLLLTVLATGCGSDQIAAAVQGVEGCRAAMECALYCTAGAGCAHACIDGASPDAAAAATSVLACAQDSCPLGEARGACMADSCELSTCYYAAGPTNDWSCARVWRCFTDCGGDDACYDDCRTHASQAARHPFAAVELCSDHYRVFSCGDTGPECDIQTMTGPCKPYLDACLEQSVAGAPSGTQMACAQLAGCGGSTEEACTAAATRVAAGCSAVDIAAVEALFACVTAASGCAEGCDSFVPGEICREVIGPGEGPFW